MFSCITCCNIPFCDTHFHVFHSDISTANTYTSFGPYILYLLYIGKEGRHCPMLLEKTLSNTEGICDGQRMHKANRCGVSVQCWLPARPADKPRGVWASTTDHSKTHSCWVHRTNRHQRASQWRIKTHSCVHLWVHQLVMYYIYKMSTRYMFYYHLCAAYIIAMTTMPWNVPSFINMWKVTWLVLAFALFGGSTSSRADIAARLSWQAYPTFVVASSPSLDTKWQFHPRVAFGVGSSDVYDGMNERHNIVGVNISW